MTSTHPSTRVLEEVFASIARFAGAGACAKVIVADGVKMREGEDATAIDQEERERRRQVVEEQIVGKTGLGRMGREQRPRPRFGP